MRAASLAVSGVALGLLGLVALTATYTVRQIASPDPPGVPVFVEPPPPPPLPRIAVTPPVPTTTDQVIFPIEAPPPTAPVHTEAASQGFVSAPGPVVIADPHWVRRPRDLERYYPRLAHELGIQGEVVLDCLVSLSGGLQCVVMSETPPNRGFAAAALRIAREHQMVPAMRGGQAVAARYRMRVPFRVR